MELFEEIYGSYFQVIRKILFEAGTRPLTRKEMEADILSTASMESALAILPKLLEGAWSPLLKKEEDGRFSCVLLPKQGEKAEDFLKPI